MEDLLIARALVTGDHLGPAGFCTTYQLAIPIAAEERHRANRAGIITAAAHG